MPLSNISQNVVVVSYVFHLDSFVVVVHLCSMTTINSPAHSDVRHNRVVNSGGLYFLSSIKSIIFFV